MGKYEKPRKKGIKHPLLLGMTIYAVLFLGAVAFGLNTFWKFIDAYESSRPKNTMDAYMQELTEDHLCDLSADLIAQIDHNLQSEEECRQVIKDSLSGELTYAKKSSASDDTHMVYVLRSGSRVIGSVTMTAVETDEFGFSRWQVTEEVFDFSYLIGNSDSVTVPSEYPVHFNGVRLNESYITESGIQYEKLEAFYEDYDLPTMATYKAGPILGYAEMSVTDTEGNVVIIDEETNYNEFLNNCTEEELADLTDFADIFIKRYVAFTGSANDSSQSAYYNLMSYVVKGSDLAKRMAKALDGLSFAQSNGDRVVAITVNQCINIGDGKYLVDVTYEVDTTGHQGVVRTTNSARIVVVDSDGLKAEHLLAY